MKSPDIFVEIARQTRAHWMRNTGYLSVLYDQSRVKLYLKTWMASVEAIEVLRFRCGA